MSHNTNNSSNTNERILSFKLSQELSEAEIQGVAGAGWLDNTTYKLVTAPTSPWESRDYNELVFDC